jgi:plasmid stability protein
MASITIRKLDERLKARLRIRAARRGRSMEEEAREILRAALTAERKQPRDLYTAIREIIDPIGGVDLEPLPRLSVREPPKLD